MLAWIGNPLAEEEVPGQRCGGNIPGCFYKRKDWHNNIHTLLFNIQTASNIVHKQGRECWPSVSALSLQCQRFPNMHFYWHFILFNDHVTSTLREHVSQQTTTPLCSSSSVPSSSSSFCLPWVSCSTSSSETLKAPPQRQLYVYTHSSEKTN